MVERRNLTAVEGTVERGSLDSMCLAHRVSIVAGDGHVYEVEPSFVGRFLERYEGQKVHAQVSPIVDGPMRSVVRVSSLTIFGNRPSEDGLSVDQPLPIDFLEAESKEKDWMESPV